MWSQGGGVGVVTGWWGRCGYGCGGVAVVMGVVG